MKFGVPEVELRVPKVILSGTDGPSNTLVFPKWNFGGPKVKFVVPKVKLRVPKVILSGTDGPSNNLVLAKGN